MSDVVSLLSGNGDGSFAQAIEITESSNATSLLAVDINRDSAVDLVFNRNQGSTLGGSVAVLLGDGFGEFASVTEFHADIDPVELTVGDLDGDDDLDVLSVNASTDSIKALLNSTIQPKLRSDGTGSRIFTYDATPGANQDCETH